MPILPIKDGIAGNIIKYSGKLSKGSLAIVGVWESLKWLKTNIKAGDKIQIVPAKAFLPIFNHFPYR